MCSAIPADPTLLTAGPRALCQGMSLAFPGQGMSWLPAGWVHYSCSRVERLDVTPGRNTYAAAPVDKILGPEIRGGMDYFRGRPLVTPAVTYRPAHTAEAMLR